MSQRAGGCEAEFRWAGTNTAGISVQQPLLLLSWGKAFFQEGPPFYEIPSSFRAQHPTQQHREGEEIHSHHKP